MNKKKETDQKIEIRYNEESSVMLKKLNEEFENLVTHGQNVERALPSIKTDRLVFGKFIPNTSFLKIIYPTWLREAYITKKVSNPFSLDYITKKENYKFDFTEKIKNNLTDESSFAFINNYESGKMFISSKGKAEFNIPSEWLNQKRITEVETGYSIYSKVVVPIMDKSSDGKKKLWGVAFIECTEQNIDRVLADREFWFLLIRRIGHLLIELDKSQIKNSSYTKILEQNKELKKLLSRKYSLKTIFISSTSLSIGLILSLIGWYYWDITVIHPLLSIPLLIGGIGFSLLSFSKTKLM